MFRDFRALAPSIPADIWTDPIRHRDDASLVMTQCRSPFKIALLTDRTYPDGHRDDADDRGGHYDGVLTEEIGDGQIRLSDWASESCSLNC